MNKVRVGLLFDTNNEIWICKSQNKKLQFVKQTSTVHRNRIRLKRSKNWLPMKYYKQDRRDLIPLHSRQIWKMMLFSQKRRRRWCLLKVCKWFSSLAFHSFLCAEGFSFSKRLFQQHPGTFQSTVKTVWNNTEQSN